MGTCCSKIERVNKTNTDAYQLTEAKACKKSSHYRDIKHFDDDTDDYATIPQRNEHTNKGFVDTRTSDQSIQKTDCEIDKVPWSDTAKVEITKIIVQENNSDAVNRVSNGNTTSGYESGGCIREDDEDRLKYKIITHNYIFLRNNMVVDELCDILDSKAIIHEEERKHIMSESGMICQADLLMQTLLQKPKFGKTEYDFLLDALVKTGQTSIVDHLKATLDSSNSPHAYDGDNITGRLCVYREDDINHIADQIDTLTVAPMCVQRECISIHDYVEIFPTRHARNKSAKMLLKCVIEKTINLHIFKNILKDCNCLRALERLEKLDKQSRSVPAIKVECMNPRQHVTVTDNSGYMIRLTIENGVSEIAIKDELTESSRSLYLFAESTNSEVLKVETGCVIIYLKTYDDTFIQQLNDSEKGNLLLCNLVKSIVGQDEIAHYFQGQPLCINVAVDRENVDCSILGEIEIDNIATSLCPMQVLEKHKNLLCSELNPYKYRKTVTTKGIISSDDACFSEEKSFRKEKMELLLHKILTDENLSDQFLTLVKESEPQDFYETITWNGSPNQIAAGIRQNFKHLIDELVPSNIIPLIEVDDTDEKNEVRQLSTVTDRRLCSVTLLRIVLNGSAALIQEFYKVLCETHPLEIAYRIRKSDSECKKTKVERPPHSTKSLQSKELSCFEEEPSESPRVFDVKNDAAMFSGNQLMKYNSDNQLKTGNLILDENYPERFDDDQQRGTFYKSDVYNPFETESTSWESNIFATRIESNYAKCFHLNQLKKDEDAIVEISVRAKGNGSESKIIVDKTTFKDDQLISIDCTDPNTCSIKSTFGDRCVDMETSDVLYIKSFNMKLFERDIRAGDMRDSKTCRFSTTINVKSRTLSGKRTSSGHDKCNMIEVNHSDIGGNVKGGDDHDSSSGYISETTSLRLSGKNR